MAEPKPVALVTGAAKGIGKELCRQLAERGYAVVLTARDAERGQGACEDLQAQGLDVRFVPMDVADPASVKAAAESVRQAFGRLDALVNNAGLYPDEDRSEGPSTIPAHVVLATFDANALGPLRTVQAFLDLLKAAAPARVVNVSSGMGQLDGLDGEAPAYSLSKLALNGLTKMQAAELAPCGIAVNAVCPGWVRTDMGGEGATRDVSQGAASVLALADWREDAPTGGFFRDGKPIPW